MLILRVGTTPFIQTCAEANFRQHGISSECSASGREALEFLRLYDYDLVLTELHLSDLSARELVRTMRGSSIKVPVLVLSHAATLNEKVELFDQGADDVLDMPFENQELLARIRAVIRRSRGHTMSALRLGPVELRLDRRDVTVNGVPLNLSRREYAALELLFLRQGTLLNKDAFLTHLYCGGDEPEMKTIDVIVCRLRKKLAAAGVPSLIDTRWGGGYILREPSAAPTKGVQDNLSGQAPDAIAA
jgi:two-component system cell cycle response regulator CtrA